MDPGPEKARTKPQGAAPGGVRLGIPTRIFLAFATVIVAFGVVSIVSVAQHSESAATMRLLHEGYLPLSLSVGRLQATEANFAYAFTRLRDGARNDSTTRWLAGARETRPERIRLVRAGVDRALGHSREPADVAVLSAVRDSLVAIDAEYDASQPEMDRVLAAFEAGEPARAEADLTSLDAREVRIAAELRTSLGRLEQRIADTSRAAAEAEASSVQTIALLALAALLAGVFVAWWAQRLLRPLQTLEHRVLAVAQGDLSPDAAGVAAARDDEIGRLAREFERMVEALSTRDRRLRDVAEALRELQKMQEQIVASLRAAVVVVGEDQRIRAANAAAASVLGTEATRVEASIKKTGLLRRVPGLGDAIESVAAGGAPVTLTAVPLEGGPEASVDVLVTPFGEASDGARRRAVLCVADDVTEALATKERLLKSERLAAMGRMAAHVTHEVRNPLSSIGLNVELLADEMHGKREAEELLRAIQREVDRLTGITEEYLRMARLPAPMLASESAGDVALGAVRFLEREMASAGVTITTKIAEELPPVLLDEAQIRQALLNLLRNAREAMPGGGHVSVEVKPEGSGVAIEVADEGAGIPADGRDRVFELFFSTKEKGTGLGLTLTREIVVAHGGRLDFRDGPRKGTVFSMWLPCAPSPAPEDTRSAA